MIRNKFLLISIKGIFSVALFTGLVGCGKSAQEKLAQKKLAKMQTQEIQSQNAEEGYKELVTHGIQDFTKAFNSMFSKRYAKNKTEYYSWNNPESRAESARKAEAEIKKMRAMPPAERNAYQEKIKREWDEAMRESDETSKQVQELLAKHRKSLEENKTK